MNNFFNIFVQFFCQQFRNEFVEALKKANRSVARGVSFRFVFFVQKNNFSFFNPVKGGILKIRHVSNYVENFRQNLGTC